MPDRVRAYLVEFFRDDVACLVSPDSKREDGLCIETTGSSPLSKSSLGVLLAALTSLYDTLIAAGYYAYENPLRSERLIALKRDHLRQVKNAGAPDHAGIRGESRAETNRAFPTNQFRQRRGKVWEPQVVLEPDAVQQRMREIIDFMALHTNFQRDRVILLLLKQTGARLSEILEMTVLGLVRVEVVEEAFKWVQSTADSVLGCFLAHLTTPVRSEKDSEYFCPGLFTSPSYPPHSLLRDGVCNW